MREEVDLCVDCEDCIGCENEKTRIYYICDSCGKSDGPVYDTGDEELCLDCLCNAQHDSLMEYIRDNEIIEQWANDCFERKG